MKDIFIASKCLGIDDIRLYLSGIMNEADQFRVENHLLDCPLCNDAVEGFANHYNFDEDKELHALSARSGGQTTKAAIRTFSIFNRIAAAVLFLLLAGAGLMYWQNQQAERLYQAYHVPFVDETFAASRSTTEGELSGKLMDVITLHKKSDYAASIPLLSEYLKAAPEHGMANMLLGIAYLENEQIANAEEILSSVRINHELYYEEASWYLALTYLRDKRTAEARLILEELASRETGYYYMQANKLLEDIR